MRKVFRHKDLYEGDFYYPIISELFNQSWKLYGATTYSSKNLKDETKERRIRNMLRHGLHNFYSVPSNITTFNNYFHKILCEGEVLVAFPLIRMQIDNLCVIYLETIYPFEILYRVIEKEMELSSIKRNQKYINLAKVRQDIDAEFGTNISELYKIYSGFIHPSYDQHRAKMKTHYSYKTDAFVATKKDVKMYAQDMVAVNQVLTNILHKHINKLKELNKTNKLK